MSYQILQDEWNAAILDNSTMRLLPMVFSRDELDLSEENEPEDRARRFLDWWSTYTESSVNVLFFIVDDGNCEKWLNMWLTSISPEGGRPCQHPDVEFQRWVTGEDGYRDGEGKCKVCGYDVVSENCYMDEGPNWRAA